MKPALSSDQLSALLAFPTISVVDAGRVLGLSRNAAYDACNRGEIEHRKFGKRIVVPTSYLRRSLGIDPTPTTHNEGQSK